MPTLLASALAVTLAGACASGPYDECEAFVVDHCDECVATGAFDCALCGAHGGRGDLYCELYELSEDTACSSRELPCCGSACGRHGGPPIIGTSALRATEHDAPAELPPARSGPAGICSIVSPLPNGGIGR